MQRPTSVFHSLALGLFLAGCGGGGGPSDPLPPPGGGGGGSNREILADPSFASHIQEIFNRRGCNDSSCHGAAAEEGLVLSPGVAYANIVGVSSNQNPGLFRIEPGNVVDSYLARKVDPSLGPITGDQMPQGRAALDNIDQTNLKNWITQGAKNN